ncbi:MAG TPA: hypothetical protein VGD17_06410 [Chitinophagaceae bacterium]
MLFALPAALAQEALAVDVKKPEKFENKKLGYEKTAEKKFTAPRRFMQNTTTHYNYYFNANNKLNEALARVKAAHRDDYTQLLPFYNYTLEKTAGEKQELDSVIYKSTVAILIHDLRSNWVDNMYMLMGKAYYYRNQLDSAYLTFQYINYAFSPKEKDGYDKVIGSNANEGGNAFTISTKENNSLVKKALTRPPSRNESFLWQIRTYLANEELPEAAGLIETLKNDPNFPSRLKAELSEVQANWFYKQNIFDSAAIYLEKALDVAANNQELSRWEYLIAQLYERSLKPELAEKFYARAIRHTFDPVMEVHARLNMIRQNKSDEKNSIQENINELLKMARKERYFNYRDIIYYTAAQMELERKNVEGARALLLKSTKYSLENQEQRNRSFLQLADLAFQEKDYKSAKSFYDSVNVAGIQGDVSSINQRKEVLNFLVTPSGVIYRQDSLQRIAAMPEKDREAFVKKMVRQSRKAQGLKEEEPAPGVSNNQLNNNQPLPPDLFTNAPKGEWYFSNQSQKAKGFTEFRSKWGNRPNVDNWRRQSAINNFALTKQGDNKIGDSPTPGSNNTIQEISYDAFTSNLPLTTEKLKLSNDSIESALLELGRVYHEKLEDHTLAVESFEKLIGRFPNTAYKEEALFKLYYSYWKLGDLTKANYYKIQLQQMFPAGKYAVAVDPALAGKSPDSLLKTNATRSYEKIYTSFIEGNFEQALADKKLADSLYGERYWTPQLLYIESIYHIKQRNDSTAKALLFQLISRFADSPLKAKAENLMNVLSKRAQIEAYLTNLEVTRADDTALATVQQPVTQPQIDAPVVKKVDSAIVQQTPVILPKTDLPKKDTVQKVIQPPVVTKMGYSFKAEEPQLVMIVLDRVDPVYVSETRNAFNRFNREKYYNKTFEITNVPLDDNIKLVVLSNFENANAAIEYVERVRKSAGSEIIPWMPPGKYTFYIISAQNLEVLKTSKDVGAYIKELSAVFPGKF